MNEPFAQFMDSLEEKLTGCSFIDNSENVIVGETYDFFSLGVDDYPRLEILIDKDKGDGYYTQVGMEQSFRASVAGYLLREEEDTQKIDMYNLITFGHECRRLIYQLNIDKETGDAPCDGFIQIAGFSEIFYEYELGIPKVSSFIFVFESNNGLPYDYTNN